MTNFGGWGNPGGGFNWDMLTNVGAGMLANSQWGPATAFGKGYSQASQNALEQAKAGLVFQEMDQKRKQQLQHQQMLEDLKKSGLLGNVGAAPQAAPQTGAMLQAPATGMEQFANTAQAVGIPPSAAPQQMAQAPPPAPAQFDTDMYNKLINAAAAYKANGEDDIAAGLLQRAQAMTTLQHQGNEAGQLSLAQQNAQFEHGLQNKNYEETVRKNNWDMTGKEYHAELTNLSNEGVSATQRRQQNAYLKKLNDQPDVYTGTGEPTVTGLKQIASGLGLEPGAAASTEAFKAASNQMINSKLGKLGSGVSNADREFLVSQYANAGNTKEGNRMIIEMNDKVDQRAEEVAKEAQKYAKAHGGNLDAGWEQRKLELASKPLFEGLKTTPTSGVQGGGSTTPNPSNAPVRKRYNQQTGDFEVVK